MQILSVNLVAKPGFTWHQIKVEKITGQTATRYKVMLLASKIYGSKIYKSWHVFSYHLTEIAAIKAAQCAARRTGAHFTKEIGDETPIPNTDKSAGYTSA